MKRLCEALASRTLAVLTVALVLGILFVSLAAEAQEAGKVYRVGILASGTHAPPVFIAGLKGAGLAEGRDIGFEARDTTSPDRLDSRSMANEVVRKPFEHGGRVSGCGTP